MGLAMVEFPMPKRSINSKGTESVNVNGDVNGAIFEVIVWYIQ